MPIYVAADSADAWANPRLFQFDKECRPTRVAGCPPDGFSAEGQLWGNPLYDWAYHRKTGYAWWIERMRSALRMYDVVRIDHFRGFDAYYSIPYGAPNAVEGTWVKGPGAALFAAIEDKLGHMEIVAEDLGLQTDSVRKMVAETGYPNMKVLHLRFYPGRRNRPANIFRLPMTPIVLSTPEPTTAKPCGAIWRSATKPAPMPRPRSAITGSGGPAKSSCFQNGCKNA